MPILGNIVWDLCSGGYCSVKTQWSAIEVLESFL